MDYFKTSESDNSKFIIDTISKNSLLKEFSYLFYWNASENPLDPNTDKKWELYKRDDQKKINEEYEKYLKNKTNKVCTLRDYKINFDKFIQINNKNESRIRQVKMISSDINKEISK